MSLLMALALASVLAPPPVAPGRGRRCEPYAERCVRNTIYTCTAAGRWRRGPTCASRRGRRVICEVEPGGAAVCVESGGATPFPGDSQ